MLSAAPVDIGISPKRSLHSSFDLLQVVRHLMGLRAPLVHRQHRLAGFVSPTKGRDNHTPSPELAAKRDSTYGNFEPWTSLRCDCADDLHAENAV